ncbi:MAG: DUF3685 domain-containing protein [Cyanobacteriota bacterium]|nr:DUF3685 domain-containing protein [Cyanobacteriota bacterium]
MAAGLTRLLEEEGGDLQVVSVAAALNGRPDLVLWQPPRAMHPQGLQREVTLLRERWQPAPLLLLLPEGHGLGRSTLMELGSEGLLEQPEPAQLLAAIATLRTGGRVLELQPQATEPTASRPGLGQSLLLGGLQQIDVAMTGCQLLLRRQELHPLARLMLEGRLRELGCARRFLLWLWGPVSMAWSEPMAQTPAASDPAGPGASTSLTLQQRNASGVWQAVRERLSGAIETGLANRSGQLLAMEGLNPQRRIDLLIALLDQLDGLRRQLAEEAGAGPGQALAALLNRWRALQPHLREQALLSMASPYVQLPQDGQLRPVASTLIQTSNLASEDPELPDAQAMLATLVLAQPLLVEGRLLPADEPQAVLHLEQLVANWLLRSAELLAADVLACCGDWPELRRYLLRPDLLSTRNLERLRNQLNAQQRWLSWFERPVALYESRRQVLCLQEGTITCVNLVEPRDQELRRLGWLQQLVTLTLETRDALAPQLRQLVRGMGDLLVVLLTQVVGRAIGLVGRGIMQGMGRSFGRS